MEERRAAISDTVDQIENRVNPGHVAARQKYRVQRTLTGWKDDIMGRVGSEGDMSERASELGESVKRAPDMVEQRTRGNPLAVGLIAVGAGALIASLLPETRQEKRIARQMQPQMESLKSEAREAGREMADDLGQSARESMDRVKDSARSAGEDVKDEAREVAERVRDG